MFRAMPGGQAACNAVVHIYKCKNRKCSQYRVRVRDARGPLHYLALPDRIRLCATCKEPMKHVALDYDRHLFPTVPIPIELPEPADVAAEILRRLANGEKNPSDCR